MAEESLISAKRLEGRGHGGILCTGEGVEVEAYLLQGNIYCRGGTDRECGSGTGVF